MKRLQHQPTDHQSRTGTTLMIVVALLGLLMFTGMVFFTFAAQERATAEYFSEAAKSTVTIPDDPMPFGLRQLLVGPTNNEKDSILWDPLRRHALLTNAVGYDTIPFNGEGQNVIQNGVGLPRIDNDHDGTPDTFGSAVENPLNYVGSLTAWFGNTAFQANEEALMLARGRNTTFPAPDVDYTYPDINNLLVSFNGWAIRDNGPTHTPPNERFQRVPVFIPSGMRPTLLKSSNTNGPGGTNTLTDETWYDHSTATGTPLFSLRNLRPSEHHVAGLDTAGNPVRRYIDVTNPADAGLIATYGAFPLRPGESGNPTDFGQLGVFTGHDPGTVGAPTGFRLDSDNTGDGVYEGIWMDLGYPVQETAGGEVYGTLFSFTIVDASGLIDLNSHGNLAELRRNETVLGQVGNSGSSPMATTSLSASNQGLGPNEVNPLYALAPEAFHPTHAAGTGPSTDSAFSEWFNGNTPLNAREQANMQWLWLLTGRIDSSDEVFDGRWGDASALWYHRFGTDGSATPGAYEIASLPRPGRAGNLVQGSTLPISFGGFQGYDDNGNALEGVASTRLGRLRGFVHPLDVQGTGRLVRNDPFVTPFDPRRPILFRPDPNTPGNWLGYDGYSVAGTPASILTETAYLAGPDQDPTTTADNLISNTRYNMAFEDPNETVNDLDRAVRPDDAIFSPADMVPAHLTQTDLTSATTQLSTRLSQLAVEAFADDSDIKGRFTTVLNSLRTIPHRHDLGNNLRNDSGTGDDGPRFWEFNADSNRDGIARDFPPRFGTIQPFTPGDLDNRNTSPADPYRAVVRRLLTTVAGENRELITQLPLSLNHILDVNRTSDTPLETSPDYLRYIQRAGMRFRPLTEHPDADETGSSGGTLAEDITSIPQVGTTAGTDALRAFPPRTAAQREFWARRDRQQVARDIYVLLYTLGGGQVDASGNIINATSDNSSRTVYSNHQLRRMAQFAVNVVDAMDTDNVITKFEYDKDLNTGWNLDDDPSTDDSYSGLGAPGSTQPIQTSDTGNGLYPEDSGTERGVVYGVEGQSLAFSEVLAVYSPEGTADADTTAYNDTTGNRMFLHMELQNMQPYPIQIASSAVGSADEEQAIWRFLRVDRDERNLTMPPSGGQAEDPQDETSARRLALMEGNSAVSGGGTFTLAIAGTQTSPTDTDPNGFGTSDIYLDDDSDGQFHLISPDVGLQTATIAPGSTVLPNCDLDTAHTSHETRFIADGDVNNTGSSFLDNLRDSAIAGSNLPDYVGNQNYGFTGGTNVPGFEVVLQRRMNPNLPRLPVSENPFVEVDRIFVPIETLNPTGMNLTDLTSLERPEPLNSQTANSTSHDAIAVGTNWRRNSIGADINDATTGPFQLWQPHFDRDFGSPIELFKLPIVGPKLLTQRLNRMRYAPYQQAFPDVLTPTLGDEDETLLSSAVAMFLQPDFPESPTNDPATGGEQEDNAWYRLLNFVEVPSRVNTMLGNYLTRHRTPGKINLNAIRHIEVYAGLIDDEVLARVPLFMNPEATGSGVDTDNQFMPFMANNTTYTGSGGSSVTDVPGTTRDRWFELVAERDGQLATYDPVSGVPQNFWIPNSVVSKPFRSLNYRKPDRSAVSGTDSGIEDTIFRESSFDADLGADDASRHWLEVGDTAGHQDPAMQSTQDQRHQILSKIYNNTTTVGNTFVIYATAAYFKAYEDPTSGLYRLGRRVGLDTDGDGTEENDSGWEQRAVFVIDRTELLNAYDEASGNFDWQRLIKYRADLQSDGR